MIRAIIRKTASKCSFIGGKMANYKFIVPEKKTILKARRLMFYVNSSVIIKHGAENIDLNLQEACNVGDSAIVEVMDVIKEQINTVCASYKACLRKQMEIMKEASDAGLLTERWDDLPEYRSLALELNQELSNFIVILNTIGAMAQNDSMKYITEQKDHINLVTQKIRELEKTIEDHTEEINLLETKILNLKREIILKIA